MVKVDESSFHQQHAACQPSNVNRIGPISTSVVEEILPARLNPHTSMFSPNVGLPNVVSSGFTTNQTCGGHGCLLHSLPSHGQGLYPSSLPSIKESGDTPVLPTQRKFLIFDQSGHQTSMFFSSAYPPTTRLVSNPARSYNSHKEVDRVYSMDENQVEGERSEMHEDTEEIDALLYSSDDDGGEDDDDDEKSTGRSPYPLEDACEEVDSYDGPSKRARLLDGGYGIAISSLEDTSSSAMGGDEGSDFEGKRTGSRKGKICESMKILESIVPNAKGKDLLSVLDEAIDYLKTLKVQAETVGVEIRMDGIAF